MDGALDLFDAFSAPTRAPLVRTATFQKPTEFQIPRVEKLSDNHEVAYPLNWPAEKKTALNPNPPITNFPFQLDPFQQEAIRCVEGNQSVVVCAHTSAGKTVVAQHAIQLSLSRKQRVIYTSPIKALSNQKYRELSDQYKDVGLLTGDTVQNPNAGCLVMTTEIVRDMLYRGDVLLSEVAWVIFDEIHYMGHKERGVVWEETIIMLPDQVRYVFLSATLPNAIELAQWVARLHQQPVSLVSSDQRPTPLCHYLFPSGGDGLYLIYDQRREFLVEGFTSAVGCLEAQTARETAESILKVSGGEGRRANWSNKKNDNSRGGGSSGDSNSGSGSSNSGGNSGGSGGSSSGSSSTSGSSSGSSCSSDSSGSGGSDGGSGGNNDGSGSSGSGSSRGSSKSADGKNRKGKSRNKKGMKRARHGTSPADIFGLVQLMLQRNMEPIILFNFSKQECEVQALALAKLDATTLEDKQLIHTIFEQATGSLALHDRMLPQVQNALPLLLRGIGLHHGGLLPVLKEITEILFGERLLKVLIATETFAMGINMPARSVVFASLSKFDGDTHRMLTSGEYTQMSGRAGRRGVDEKGFSIAVLEEPIDEAEARQLVCGEAARLDSAFEPRYGMLLNASRAGGDPDYLLRHSFRQFQHNLKQARIQQEIETARSRVSTVQSALAEVKTDELEEYFNLRSEIELRGNRLRQLFYDPIYVGPFLEPGRVVEIRTSDGGGLWGIIIKYYKQRSKDLEEQLHNERLLCSLDPAGFDHMLEVLVSLDKACVIETVSLRAVLSLSSIKLFLPKDILSSVLIQSHTLKSIEKLQEGFQDGLPAVDPFADLGFPRNDPDMLSLVSEVESLEARLFKMPIAKRAQKSCLRFGWYEEQSRWTSKVAQLEKQLQAGALEFAASKHKGMLVVLRRLGYLTAEGVIDIKGRVACMISACDELAACELMMHGGFQELTAPQMCALLSCLVRGAKQKDNSGDESGVPEGLKAPLQLLKDVVARISQVMVDARVIETCEQYSDMFQFSMAEVLFQWASGASFQEVCSLTDLFEGQVVRVIRHVADVLRQLSGAAKLLGDNILEASLAHAASCLHRDIVFACSLYL